MPKYVGKFDATKKAKDIKEITPEEISALRKQKNYAAITGNIVQKLSQIISKEDEKLPTWEDKKFITTSLLPVTGIADGKDTKVAIVATVSAGKSTLLNVLCEYPILPAASNTTSCAPTYITRAASRADEAVKIRPLKKVESDLNGIKNIEFVHDQVNERVLKADTITETFFNDLLDYMMLVMCGDGGDEYATTLENVAYFMTSPASADVEFRGSVQEKLAIKREDFSFSYHNPRHRLLLLLILLCVYVKQNEKPANLSPYYVTVNKARKKLMDQYGIPADGDYSVCLNWCCNSIPEGTTLIDLPGTGADTQDSDTQSSHTVIVKGILRDADALWILTSDNGTIEPDLYDTLKDIIEIEKNTSSSSTKKNFVCIYNCKNGNTNDSKPVEEFIQKLPCLIGERCYVMNALAGEYQYLSNGITDQNTKEASTFRKGPYAFMSNTVNFADILNQKYTCEKCPTYVVIQDEHGNARVKQESNISFSLEGFFKTALTDYATRLRYEVALKETLIQIDFYGRIMEELHNTLALLKSIHGSGASVATAVEKALNKAYDVAINKFSILMAKKEAEVSLKLRKLSGAIGPELKTAFDSDYVDLINRIHKEWKTLKQSGHVNGLETNFWGNYPLKAGHDNWKKFTRVRDKVSGYISISAFAKARKVADDKVGDYFTLLTEYVAELKKVTDDFRNDYLHAFMVEYDRQKEKICMHDGRVINDTLLYNFTSSKDRIRDAIDGGLQTACKELYKKFDTLVAPNGIFEKVRIDTKKEFDKQLSDQILDSLRMDIRSKYTSVNHMPEFLGLTVRDYLDVDELDDLIKNSFGDLKNTCQENLGRIVEAIYGLNLMNSQKGGSNSVNFPRDLSAELNSFNADALKTTQSELNTVHKHMNSFIRGSADGVTDLGLVIKEVNTAITEWDKIGDKYVEIGSYLITEGSPLVETLCSEYMTHIPQENK